MPWVTAGDAEHFVDDTGRMLIEVHAEWTRDGNKHCLWVWTLHDREYRGRFYNVQYGADPDREVAKSRGWAALQMTLPR